MKIHWMNMKYSVYSDWIALPQLVEGKNKCTWLLAEMKQEVKVLFKSATVLSPHLMQKKYFNPEVIL